MVILLGEVLFGPNINNIVFVKLTKKKKKNTKTTGAVVLCYLR